jgi:hypothetical protein
MHDAIGTVRCRHDVLAPHGIAGNPLHLGQMRCAACRPLGVAMQAAHAPTPLQERQGDLAADAAGGSKHECGSLVDHVSISRFDLAARQSGARDGSRKLSKPEHRLYIRHDSA